MKPYACKSCGAPYKVDGPELWCDNCMSNNGYTGQSANGIRWKDEQAFIPPGVADAALGREARLKDLRQHINKTCRFTAGVIAQSRKGGPMDISAMVGTRGVILDVQSSTEGEPLFKVATDFGTLWAATDWVAIEESAPQASLVGPLKREGDYLVGTARVTELDNEEAVRRFFGQDSAGFVWNHVSVPRDSVRPEHYNPPKRALQDGILSSNEAACFCQGFTPGCRWRNVPYEFFDSPRYGNVRAGVLAGHLTVTAARIILKLPAIPTDRYEDYAHYLGKPGEPGTETMRRTMEFLGLWPAGKAT